MQLNDLEKLSPAQPGKGEGGFPFLVKGMQQLGHGVRPEEFPRPRRERGGGGGASTSAPAKSSIGSPQRGGAGRWQWLPIPG